MSQGRSESQTRFFAPFPERGVWTAVGLTRGQFFGIFAISTALFFVIGGPLWDHLREGHLARIVWSYAAIPVLVVLALARNRRLELFPAVGATIVLGFAKWIVTAALTMVLGLMR